MKTCFKCNNSKELSEFYVHKQMTDGHINACKQCERKDAIGRHERSKQHYAAYDKKRGSKRGTRKPLKLQYIRHSYTEAVYKTWKGSNLDYRALHVWVEKMLGKPTTCSKCFGGGLVGAKIHWANKSGNYLREVSDWERLCVSCHAYKDNLIKRNTL